jgi:hypothetical protein
MDGEFRLSPLQTYQPGLAKTIISYSDSALSLPALTLNPLWLPLKWDEVVKYVFFPNLTYCVMLIRRFDIVHGQHLQDALLWTPLSSSFVCARKLIASALRFNALPHTFMTKTITFADMRKNYASLTLPLPIRSMSIAYFMAASRYITSSASKALLKCENSPAPLPLVSAWTLARVYVCLRQQTPLIICRCI